MRLEIEPILCRPDRAFHSVAVEEPQFRGPFHRHAEIELVAILASGGRLVAGDYSGTFSAGDVFLFGPDLPHIFRNTTIEMQTKTMARALVVQFREDFAGPGLFALPDMASVVKVLRASRRGLQVLPPARDRVRGLVEAIHTSQGPRRIRLLLEAIEELAAPRVIQPLASKEFDSDALPAEGRMPAVMAHIQEGLTEVLDIPTLAIKAGLSVNAFSRWFRQQTGQTCTGMINALRIREACRLLDESTATVTEVALSCGFGNLAHFHKEFSRRVGISPGRYRRRSILKDGQ